MEPASQRKEHGETTDRSKPGWGRMGKEGGGEGAASPSAVTTPSPPPLSPFSSPPSLRVDSEGVREVTRVLGIFTRAGVQCYGDGGGGPHGVTQAVSCF